MIKNNYQELITQLEVLTQKYKELSIELVPEFRN